MARRKKTREAAAEIRESALADPLRDFEGSPMELMVAKTALWLRDNIQPILIGLAVVVVAATGYIIYSLYAEEREQASLKAFEELLNEPVMTPGSGAEAIALEKLDEYMANYSHATASRRARVKSLALLEAEEKWKEAAETAMSLGDELSAPELRSYFYTRAGFSFEQAGSSAFAANAFSRAVQNMREENFLQATARFGEGRALSELGKTEEAQQVFDAILDNDSQGYAEVRLAATAYLLSRR